jgi:hypothetical protein
VQPRRLVSSVLATFPWYSAAICSSNDLTDVVDESSQVGVLLLQYNRPVSCVSKHFAKSLDLYEASLFNRFSSNAVTSRLQSGLGIGSSQDVVPWHPESNQTSQESSRLCSVMSAYRLMDVVSMLGGSLPAPSVDRCHLQIPTSSFRVSTNLPAWLLCCLKYMQGMEKLADWPKVLREYRQILSKSKKTAKFSTPPASQSSPFRLLSLIARNQTTKNYTAIEANFLYAAMHIACMKELCFPKEACPDLPDDIDALVQA